VAAGQQTMEIVADIGSGTGAITNIATVTSTSVDPVSGNDIAFATTSVSGADVSVTKVVDLTEANPGDQLTYTITVQNEGPDIATDVALTDVLPDGVSYVSANPIEASQVGQTLTWATLSTLTVADGPQLYTVVAEVLPGTTADQVNTASVTSASTDPDPSDDQDTATTSMASADLAVTKTGTAAADAGGSVSYTITVTNHGPSAATSVVVTDVLDDGLIYDAGSTSPTPDDVTGQTVTWNVASLANGADTVFTLGATVDGDAPTSVTNTASVSSATNDPNPANDSDSQPTTVTPQADLGVTKTGTAAADAGGSVSYTITVTNHGPSAATSVVVTDVLDDGLIYDAGSTSPTPDDVTGQTVTWNVASLVNGANTVFTLGATLDAAASGTLDNTASVISDTNDPNSANDSDTQQTTVTIPQDPRTLRSKPPPAPPLD
jgi:uncharacterized repeat protein (TIGR01451 family)